MSKSKKMAKVKTGKPVVLAAVTPTITLTNPSQNTLHWTFPQMSSDRKVVWTIIDWKLPGAISFDHGGVKIDQIDFEPDIETWTSNAPGNPGNSDIAAGTWDVRVAHFTAVGSLYVYDAATMDNGSFSDWVTITFD